MHILTKSLQQEFEKLQAEKEVLKAKAQKSKDAALKKKGGKEAAAAAAALQEKALAELAEKLLQDGDDV